MRKLANQAQKRAVVDAYFAADARPTVSGLARVLRKSRQDLVNYKGTDLVVIEGLARVEEYLESRLGGAGERGAMFSLKNQFGWTDVKLAGAPVTAKAAPVAAKGAAVAAPLKPVRRARDMTDEELMAIIDGRA